MRKVLTHAEAYELASKAKKALRDKGIPVNAETLYREMVRQGDE